MFYKMLMNFDTNKRPHGGIYMEMIFPTEATGRGGGPWDGSGSPVGSL